MHTRETLRIETIAGLRDRNGHIDRLIVERTGSLEAYTAPVLIVADGHIMARVAEEWAVVDNLSGGRIGLAIASGWHPRDFVLRPENFAAHKKVTFESIDVLQRLWRGEAVAFPGPQGDPIEIRTLPRPIQPEGHLAMMAAVQPFLSGGISKTINLPEAASIEDIEWIYLRGWKLGLKALAVFRENSKGIQPVTTRCEIYDVHGCCD